MSAWVVAHEHMLALVSGLSCHVAAALTTAGVCRFLVSRAKLDGGFTVFVAVGLSKQRKTDQEAFEKVMLRTPEVIECHNVSGSIEYILKVEVSDLAAYKKFHAETLGTCPELKSITSYIAMSSPKEMG